MADASNRDPNKEKALTAALSQIERQFGKGSMMRLGDKGRETVRWAWMWHWVSVVCPVVVL